MKRRLVFIAAGIVVVAHLWALLSVSQNRSGAPGGTLELTERELRLSPIGGESTALFLELEWDALSDPPDRRYHPRWLDASKLSELGFDCTVAVTAPHAEEHYRSLLPRPVFLVLEYGGEAWKQAPEGRRRTTRLFAVDAGLDPERLRGSYSQTNRYIIARAVVRLRLERNGPQGGEPQPEPRLQGAINTLLPHQVFVPRPHRDLLQDSVDFKQGRKESRISEPRFAATISWGHRYEPWVTSVRLLSSSP